MARLETSGVAGRHEGTGGGGGDDGDNKGG